MQPEVKLLSLTMTDADDTVLATLNVITNSCLTSNGYSSCHIDLNTSHRSTLKVLVSNLEDGESRKYGCQANTIDTRGATDATTWYTIVTRKCEYVYRACRVLNMPDGSKYHERT